MAVQFGQVVPKDCLTPAEVLDSAWSGGAPHRKL